MTLTDYTALPHALPMASLARRIGVSREYLSQIRRGKRPLSDRVAGLLDDVAMVCPTCGQDAPGVGAEKSTG